MILSDTSGISIWSKPLLVVAGIIILIGIMLGIIKLFDWLRRPTLDD